ncbi:MAG: hypothetical protein F6K44_29775, partial [Moorea sp. SIO3E2]|nr:hypothetical protein [Moorena sp. SIO3E2]
MLNVERCSRSVAFWPRVSIQLIASDIFPIPDSRFPIPDSRFPIPVPLLGGVRGGFRFPIPDSRFPIPTLPLLFYKYQMHP